MKPPFCDFALDGKKTWEVQGTPTKKENTRIYLYEIGGDGSIQGSVYINECKGPLTRDEWVQNRQKHCCADAELPYGDHTYAWGLSDPERFDKPQPCSATSGGVWRKAPKPTTKEADEGELITRW